MDVLKIESFRSELLSVLENSDSRRLKLKRISEFFELLLECESHQIINSYLLEFIPQYVDYLKNYSPFGVKPEFTQSILSSNAKLEEISVLGQFIEGLRFLDEQLERNYVYLTKILEGRETDQIKDNKVLFPVIENEEGKTEGTIVIGAIDSLTVKISKTTNMDRFLVVPSEREGDKILQKQIDLAWYNAKQESKKYVDQIGRYHEVIISFDEHLGFYRGDSFGAALTIALIGEMLKLYNSKTVLTPIERIVFTGGINEKGEISQVTKEYIEKKLEIVFYSDCKVFAVPKTDEAYAQRKLEDLNKEYPNRRLAVVGVKNLHEILLRRDLVEIKKQNAAVRAGKFIAKNWVGALFVIILTALLTFFFSVDFDDNPVSITLDGQLINVKNKKGKILWTKRVEIDLVKPENAYLPKMIYRIDDINNDNHNELILCHEIIDSLKDTIHPERIACYDYKGIFLWQYYFQDSVSTHEKLQQPIYTTLLIDLRSERNNKVLYALAKNTYYASAIFKLDVLTGERLEGTLWNAGHFEDGIIGDFNNDGKEELVLSFINNGFERCGLASINLEEMKGQLPTTDRYKFSNMKQAHLIKMVILPVTDYLKYLGDRFNYIMPGNLIYQDNVGFRVVTQENINPLERTSINYTFDTNLNCIDVECGDAIQVKRDLLVTKNILRKPFTNTIEYENLLKSEIIYK